MNRRSFFAGLLATLAAAMATLKLKKKYTSFSLPTKQTEFVLPTPSYRCFNCQQWTGVGKLLPDGFRIEGRGDLFGNQATRSATACGGEVEVVLHLCDNCIKSITHCATCGNKLYWLPPETIGIFLDKNGRIPYPPNVAYCQIWNSRPQFNFTQNELTKLDDPKSPYGVTYLYATLRFAPTGSPLFKPADYFGIRWATHTTRDLIVADCGTCAKRRNNGSTTTS
jgi:hypothetical protein